MDCSPPGSSVHGILQTRILEWVAISSSQWSSRPRDRTHIAPGCPVLQADSLPLSHLGSLTNLDSILKSRDITLPTKVHIVKAVVFPVVMYRCESWTIKKAEGWKLMLSNCGALEDSWESLGQQGDKTSQSYRKSTLNILWKDLILKCQYFGHLMQRANSLEKTLMLGKIKGRRRSGWQDEMVGMALSTQ